MARTFVEENNLTQNISSLRKAFGKDRYIETIPSRGYRFPDGRPLLALFRDRDGTWWVM